jgi:hypothetical protein
MAIYTHGVDPDAVMVQYPRSRGLRTPTEDSPGLNLPMLRDFIEDASAEVNAILRQHGYGDPENDLPEEGARVCRTAVIKYAIGQALQSIGTSEEARTYLDQYTAKLKILREMPEYAAATPYTERTFGSAVTSSTRSRAGRFEEW